MMLMLLLRRRKSFTWLESSTIVCYKGLTGAIEAIGRKKEIRQDVGIHIVMLVFLLKFSSIQYIIIENRNITKRNNISYVTIIIKVTFHSCDLINVFDKFHINWGLGWDVERALYQRDKRQVIHEED